MAPSLVVVPPFLPYQLYVIDGGLSTQLSNLGHPELDSDPLWTARALVSAPDTVVRAHRDFLAAGARVLITNSYQVSVEGFKEHLGLDERATRRAVTTSVELAWRAVREEGLVAGEVVVGGSVGPWGACRHDGSEYRGGYERGLGREALAEWHRPRVEALVEGRASVLALETLPSSLEALAVMDCVLEASPSLPLWVSFTVKEGACLGGGEGVGEAVKVVLGHPLAR